MSDTKWTRRQFAGGLVAGGIAWGALPGRVCAEEVAWLSEVTTPPVPRPKPQRRLAPLLVDDSGRRIRTREAWERQRAVLRKTWSDFLGIIDARRPNSPPEVIRSERVGDVVRERIRYECEPGIPVPAYVLKPADLKAGETRAGIVALHPTTSETIEPIAGVRGPEEKQTGIHLARAGFVVLCPENFLWQNAKLYTDAVEKFHERHPKSLGMAKMLYDAQRATDVLQSLPNVDGERIGAFGHSLGAKEVLYLAAFDDRIKAAVASEGGIAFESTNWDAVWYLGKAIDAPKFPLAHHQLLALIAPRPFLILAGESGRGAADGDRSWPYVAAAQEVARLYGPHPELGILNHRQGHSIPRTAREKAIEWLQSGLAAR